jgi:CHAT domain-containing protein/Tfp pilus assembly protein PilF
MIKFTFSIILFLLLSLNLFSQQPCENQNIAVSLYEKAQQAQNNSNFEQAASYSAQAALIFEKCANWDNYAIVKYMEANCLLSINETEKGQQVLESTKNILQREKQTKSKVYALICHNLGEIYYQQNQYQQSVDNYEVARAELTELFTLQSDEVATCLYNLGNSYEKLQKYSKALNIHLLSLNIKQHLPTLPDSAYLIDCYTIIGSLYQNITKYDSAFFYYHLASKYLSNRYIEDIKQANFLKFKTASLYASIEKTDLAIANYQEVRLYSIAISDTISELYINTLLNIGSLYGKKEMLDSSYLFIKQAYTITKNNQQNINQNELKLAYSHICLTTGRIDECINQYFDVLKNGTLDSCELTKAYIYTGLAKAYENKSELNVAENYYKLVIQQIKLDSIKYVELYAGALLGLAEIKSKQNNEYEYITFTTRAENLLKDIENSDLLADIYILKGNIYLSKYQLDKAEGYYKKAQTFYVNKYSKEYSKTLLANENMAQLYMIKGEINKAIELWNNSIQIKLAKYGNNHPELAGLYSNLANAFFETGKIEDAANYYNRALFILMQYDNLYKSQIISLYNNMGIYYRGTGNFAKSIEYFNQSIELRKGMNESESIEMANTYNNIGSTYDNLGNYELAMKYFELSENMIIKLEGDSAVALADVYLNKGNILNKQFQNDLAMKYYDKALSLKTKYLSKDHPEIAAIYNNIGSVYQNNGNLKLALEYFEKSLKARTTSSISTNYLAATYNNIGNIYQQMEKYSVALNNYNKALNIYTEHATENQSMLANTYNNIASAYALCNRNDSAILFYEKSISIYNKTYGDKHPYMSLIYNNIGDAYLKNNNPSKAIYFYQLAIISNNRNLNLSDSVIRLPPIAGYFNQNSYLKSIFSKARALSLLKGKENFELSLQHYWLCDSLITNLRKSAVSTTDKLALGDIASKCYDGAIYVCCSLSNLYKNDSANYYHAQAFVFAEKSKSSVLLESLAGQDAMNLSSIPAELKQKEADISSNISYYEKLLAEKPDNESEIRSQLFDLNKQYNTLINKFEKEYPDYYTLKYSNKTVSLNDLQSGLPQNAQMRMYVTGSAALYIFAITKNKINIEIQPLYANLNDSIKKYRDCLMQSAAKFAKLYPDMANQLYQYLFPDNPDSIDIKQIIIIPDGKLSQIPFESLLYEKYYGSIYSYQDYPYLIQKFNITYSFSSTLFLRNLNKSNKLSDNKYSWMAFAPIFTNAKSTKTVFDNRIPNFIEYGDQQYNTTSSDIAPLPSTEKEVSDIYSLFDKNGHHAKMLLFGSANRKYMQSDSLQNFNILHFATHGTVNSDNPELSGIQLAISPDDAEKGMFYANDIYNLKLRTNLVVLSACETGLGKVSKGEGIIGLSRAFFYAGTPNLIVSLWKVSDVSTSQLMIHFYENMMNNTNNNNLFSNNLREAKLKLINEKKYAKPYFWAPFIILGN